VSIKQQLFTQGGEIPVFSLFSAFPPASIPKLKKVVWKNIRSHPTILDRSENDEI